jgi:NADH-quinone oxidoreductase subunit M
LPALSLLIFLPIAASLLILVFPAAKTFWIRAFAIVITGAELILSFFVYFRFDKKIEGYQFFEEFDWITLEMGEFGKLSIDYCLGLDGISLPLILLSTIVFFIAALASNTIKEKQKGYYSLLLLLLGTIIGCFLALDFFLFFLFFEFMLLPMYFLIGIWGGPRREYASIKFFLYTLFGSVLILIVMICLYSSVFEPNETAHSFTMNIFQYLLHDNKLPDREFVHTLRIDHLSDPHNFINGSLLHIHNKTQLMGFTFRQWAFLLLLIGFIIKLPAVPFHTWLPDAHVEAPTPVSVILAAVLLKIGAYGLIRIAYPIFPQEAIYFSTFVACIGVFSIIYAAYNALAQNDLKKMIAYSSVSHMGFVLLGLAAFNVEGVSGAIYQLVSHGFISAGLFLVAGVIYEQTHDRTIGNYRGLANEMPYFTAIVVILFFASLGLPAFSGFIAEIFVFLGAFKSTLIPKWLPIVATLGLVISAAYYLWALQRMFFGKFWIKESLEISTIKDVNKLELLCLIPLVALVILLGVYPSLLTELFNPAVKLLLK